MRFQRTILLEAKGSIVTASLRFLGIMQEIIRRTEHIKITNDDRMVSFAELDEYLVKLLYLLRVAFGLYGNVIVRDSSRHLQVAGEHTLQLQVEGGVEYHALIAAEGK